MTQKIISLALLPLKNNEIVVTTSIQIYVHVSNEPHLAPSHFNPHDPRWILLASDLSYTSTNNYFNHILSLKVDGTPINKFLFWNGVSLWQFLPAHLWPSFFKAIKLIEAIIPFVQNEKPTLIRFFPVCDSTFRIWEGVIQGIGKAMGIKIVKVFEPGIYRLLSKEEIKHAFRKFGVGRLLQRIRNSIFRISYRYTRFLNKHDSNKLKATPPILFCSVGRNWTRNPFKPQIFFDEQIYPLIDSLKKRGPSHFIAIDCPYDSHWTNFFKLISRIFEKKEYLTWKSFYFYSPGKEFSYQQVKSFLSGRWATLKKSEVFLKDFKYCEVPLIMALEYELKYAFRYVLTEYAAQLSIAAQVIEHERPQAVIATYETGPFQRALTIESKKRNIPTIGLMHGMIFANHYDYMHDHVYNSLPEALEYFSIPDITCVWGPFWKKSLTVSGHYPETSVVTTGNWKYDETHDHPEKTLDDNNNIKEILILSSGQKVPEFIEQCLTSIQNFHNCRAKIKLHPGDDPLSIFPVLKKMRFSTNIIQNTHLITALKNCDIVISQISTAIAEAAFMKKPVIVVDFQNLAWNDYEKFGISLKATDLKTLIDALKTLLIDEEMNKKIRANQSSFISEYFLSTDSKASDRVADAVMSLIAKSPVNEAPC